MKKPDPTTQWSAADEVDFQRMVVRRSLVLATQHANLEAVLEKCGFRKESVPLFCDHARDMIRALQPFADRQPPEVDRAGI